MEVHGSYCIAAFATQKNKNRNVQYKTVLHVDMMLLVAMVDSLQLLPYNFFHPNYSFSPLSEHKVLGIGELGETGMLLYLAWPGLSQLPCVPSHTLTCGHSGIHTHTHTHAHKASVAAKTWRSSVSNPSQQSAVLTARTLSSSHHRETTLKANTNCFGSRLTCRPFPGIWLKWVGSQTLSSRRWEGFCHSRAVFWQGAGRKKIVNNFIYKKKKQLVPVCVCSVSHSPGCLYSTELDNCIITGSVLQWQGVKVMINVSTE